MPHLLEQHHPHQHQQHRQERFRTRRVSHILDAHLHPSGKGPPVEVLTEV